MNKSREPVQSLCLRHLTPLEASKLDLFHYWAASWIVPSSLLLHLGPSLNPLVLPKHTKMGWGHAIQSIGIHPFWSVIPIMGWPYPMVAGLDDMTMAHLSSSSRPLGDKCRTSKRTFGPSIWKRRPRPQRKFSWRKSAVFRPGKTKDAANWQNHHNVWAWKFQNWPFLTCQFRFKLEWMRFGVGLVCDPCILFVWSWFGPDCFRSGLPEVQFLQAPCWRLDGFPRSNMINMWM